MALGLPQKYDIFFIKMQINLNTKSYAAFQVISEHDANVSFKNPLSKKNKNKPQFDD